MSLQSEDARKQRDLFLEFMREDNPDFALFEKSVVRAAVASTPEPTPKDRKPKFGYHCTTQSEGALTELYIGLQKGSVYLWENGSVINWSVRRDGYPSEQQALDAAIGLYRACMTWNKIMDGRVTFRLVDNLSDSAFLLQYGGDGGRTLARAFFPDQYRRSLNYIRIFAAQFDPRIRAQYPIYNTMLHELGHVLGLRHEFAHTNPREKRFESILYGINNPDSVMAYYPAPKIQESDIEYTQKAYDELDDGKTLIGEGPFSRIRKVILRVEPNN